MPSEINAASLSATFSVLDRSPLRPIRLVSNHQR